MVIIEVNRHYAHFDRILGEHRWSEFLQNPTKEENGRVTKVFYCTYNTGRIVQKNGALGEMTSGFASARPPALFHRMLMPFFQAGSASM